MPKIAFLILAHEYPDMLARLVRRLIHPEAKTFVHVDGKQDIRPYKAAAGADAVFLEGDARIVAYWGAFSVIRATLNLLRTALVIAPSTERFILISGVSYPVKPIAEIIHALSRNVEVIQVDRALDPKGRGKFDVCANRIFLGENKFLNPRTGPRWLEFVRAIVARTPRLPGYGETVYYGPPHWALTREAVLNVLETMDKAPRKLNWFRYSLYPDEMVFHTLLKNSSRSSFISHDATKSPPNWHPRLAGIGYIDWENPNPNIPRILELCDLEQIRTSGALFARKMHPQRSVQLLDALDAPV